MVDESIARVEVDAVVCATKEEVVDLFVAWEETEIEVVAVVAVKVTPLGVVKGPGVIGDIDEHLELKVLAIASSTEPKQFFGHL